MKKNLPMTKSIRKMFIAGLATLWIVSALSPILAAQESSTPLKALIITGQNYHDWKLSSAAMKQMLEDTGLFQVDIAVSPPAGGDMKSFKPNFSPYKIIVLDYSGDAWPRSTQKAFVDFVKNGGGLVVFHSANNSFPDWPEYNEIIGLAGWGGRTEKAGPYVYWKDGQVVRDAQPGLAGYHTPTHPFLIVIRDANHPITAGLPQKWMHAEDELYGLLRGPAKNLNVLATAYSAPEQSGIGRHEPMLFTINYGSGRVFHTVLGHVGGESPPALECVGFIATFQRGAEWAATGRVTQKIPGDFPGTERDISSPADVRRWPGYRPPSFDALLQEFAAFERSENDAIALRLHEYVLTHKNSPESRAECEEKFLAFLESKATHAAKMEACRHLRLIGSDKAVPVLEKMLLQDDTVDMARYALEKIPGPTASLALINALGKTQGATQISLISSLGQRKCHKAVPELSLLLEDQDEAVAVAAATSLGQIGTPEAAESLSQSLGKAQGERREVVASSLLISAEGFTASKDSARAKNIYDKVLATDVPLSLRQAALKGRIGAADKEEGAKMILDTLMRGPAEIHALDIGLVPKFFDGSSVGSVASLLPKLPEAGQVQLLAVLTDYPREVVLPFVLNSARSQAPAVRIAAVKALAKVGDASSVPLLAERAASARGPEQDAARASLWTLQGKEVDEAILFQLVSHPSEPVRNELIQAGGERRIYAAKNLLISQGGSASFTSSLLAARALRAIASPDDLPALISILLDTKDETVADEMMTTIGAIAQNITDPYSRGQSVEEMLEPGENLKVERVSDAPKRCILYRLLGRIGDDTSLPLLRDALKSENADIVDAVIRALSEWPTIAPRDDVFEIARTSTNLTHQVLAVRGYVRMIGLEKFQSPQSAVQSLQKALEITKRPDEIKLVLGVLPEFACPEALRLAESFLNVEGVKEEAAAAVTAIKERLKIPSSPLTPVILSFQ